jgi:hypothetical protein
VQLALETGQDKPELLVSAEFLSWHWKDFRLAEVTRKADPRAS